MDPRGLLTPSLDSWSLDGWVLAEDGRCLPPSRASSAIQNLAMTPRPTVVTETGEGGLTLLARAWVETGCGGPVCRFLLNAAADTGGWLVLALRPYNPEGISFIHEVELSADHRTWTIDGRSEVALSQPA